LTGSDGIGDTAYTIGGITDNYPLMKPWTTASGHCVTVISVLASKNIIGQGFSCGLKVCVADNGQYTESFGITAYANDTLIGAKQVNDLSASCQMFQGYVWNTAGMTYANFTVRVCVEAVAGQTDVSGINFTLGTLRVTIPGDINGDFKVSVQDLTLLANAYRTTPGSPKWNPNADIDGDGVVGLLDLTILAVHYGQRYP
jgi:hypothetical protein